MKKHTKARLAKICLFSMALSIFSGIQYKNTFADTWPDTDKSHIKSAQPHFSGYRVRDIEVWDKDTDPYSELMQAKVPLQTRNLPVPATQANPGLNDKTEVMLMQADYGNSFFDSTIANNSYGNVAFNFWQYTDYFCPWHGAATIGTPRSLYDPATSDWRARGFEFGIVNIPNQAYINAAHKNGVKAIACVYFDPSFRPGQTKDEMFVKDTDGNFVVAKKLVEMARHYGFDGYFLNNEEADDERFKDFMAYLSEQGMYTQFYDTNSNFDENKSQHLKNNRHHKIHDSVFVNYGWNGVDKFVAHAAKIGVDPHKAVFLGIEANHGQFANHPESLVKDSYTSQTDKNPLCSIALFTPSDMYQRGIDELAKKLNLEKQFPIHQRPEYQWMIAERERMYFSGVTCDPKNTGSKDNFKRPDVLAEDASYWPGVADFKAEASVIKGKKFFSTFNIGKGMQYFSKGVVVNDEPWTDLNDQDILPTWQWWFESKNKTLKADFDFGEKEIRNDVKGQAIKLPFKQVGAYHGGSSLAVYGPLKENHTMKLFKTDLEVTNTSQAKIAFRKTSNDTATMKLGLRFKDKTDKLTLLEIPDSSAMSDSFVEKTLALGAYAGKKIASIELVFEGTSDNYQMNIGSLSISDGGTPHVPAEFKVERIYSDKQAVFSWKIDDYSLIDKYRLYAEADGKTHFLGGIYDDKLYVKNYFFENKDRVTFKLVKVGKDGSESEAATQTVDFSKLPTSLTISETDGAYGKQAEKVGEITLNFETAGDSAHKISIKPVSIPATTSSVSDISIPAGTKTATIPVPFLNGEDYDLTLTPMGEQIGISYRGRFHDSTTESLSQDDVLWTEYKKLALRSPLIRDWKQLEVKFTSTTGEIKQLANHTRGASANYHAPFGLPADKGTITFTITDYNGNKKDFIVQYDESFKRELLSLEEKYTSVLENETLANLLYSKENLEETLNALRPLIKAAKEMISLKTVGRVEDTLSEQKTKVEELIKKIKETAKTLKDNPALVDYRIKLKLPNISKDSVMFLLTDEAQNPIPPLTIKEEKASSENASLTYAFRLEKGKDYHYSITSGWDAIKSIEGNISVSSAHTEEIPLSPIPSSLLIYRTSGENVCKRGEPLDLAAYTVELRYQSGTNEKLLLSNSDFEISDYNTDTIREVEIQVSYFGVSEYFTFKVIPNDNDPAEIIELINEVKFAKELQKKAEYIYAAEERKNAFDQALLSAEMIILGTEFERDSIISLLDTLKKTGKALDGLTHKPLVPEITTTYTALFFDPPELDKMVDGSTETYALFGEGQKKDDTVTFTYPREIKLKSIEVIYCDDPSLIQIAGSTDIKAADIEIKSEDTWIKVGSLENNTVTKITLNEPKITKAIRIKISQDASELFAISEFKAEFEAVQIVPDSKIAEKKEELKAALAEALNKKKDISYQKADEDKKIAFDAALQMAETLLKDEDCTAESLLNALNLLKNASASLNGLENHDEQNRHKDSYYFPIVSSETVEEKIKENKEEKSTEDRKMQEEDKIQADTKKEIEKTDTTSVIPEKEANLIEIIKNYTENRNTSKSTSFQKAVRYLSKKHIKTPAALKKKWKQVQKTKKKLLKQKQSMKRNVFNKKLKAANKELKEIKNIMKLIKSITK